MNRRFTLPGVALVVALALGVWLLFSLSEDAPREPPGQARSANSEPPARSGAVREAKVERPPPTQTPKPNKPSREVHDGPHDDPILGPRDYDPERHAHPITAEHLHIQHENRLIQALNDAMDTKNVKELRNVLEMYRSSHPEDPHALQGGYAVIADCLENPGPDTRAAGERYMEEERASTLRRFVRRHCVQAIP